MKKIKIGVIGLGFVAQNIHLPRILATPEFNLIGVSDQSTEKVKNTAQSFNVEGYVDYVKLCERKDVDAVFILTPPHSHYEIAKIAAENKKHIFCEKPLAMNVDQAEQILAETEKAGVILMVGYMMRFSNNILVLKRMLPLLGEKLNAETVFSTTLPEKRATFHYNKEHGGGVLFEMGIHHVNLLRWFFGEGKPVNVKMKMKGDVDVLTNFSLTFQNKVVSQSEVTWVNPFFRNAVFVKGENGYVKTYFPLRSDEDRLVSFQLRNGVFREAGELSIILRRGAHSQDEYQREIDHFADCILTDQVPLTSGSDALEDIKLVSDIYSLGNLHE